MKPAHLVSLRKIWDKASHNALTDLIRYRGLWYCTFREGMNHVSPDGKIRIIRSEDGVRWCPTALLSYSNGDLRDPKFSVTPDGKLMMNCAVALEPGKGARHRSLVYLSEHGSVWSGPQVICDPDFWLWRISWHENMAYGVAYITTGQSLARLYRSEDGLNFKTILDPFQTDGNPNESTLLFLPDDRCLCLMRRESRGANGWLGEATPPYTDWSWKDIGARVGGPHLFAVPDGELLYAGRLVQGRSRTSICSLDPDSGRLTECLALPSGGDNSYPGLAYHNGHLWVTYYSSHENRTSVYLAQVAFI